MRAAAEQLIYSMLVLCNMAEYLSDFDDVDYDFEYDGRPYRFEPEYTAEELLERRMQKQRNSWPENNRPLHVRESMLTGGRCYPK